MSFETANLEETFKKNLEFFKEQIPLYYEKFKDYEPEADLVIDNGRITVYDRKKESYLYPNDGRLIAYEQLAQWMANPQFITLSNTKIEGNPEWLHIRYMGKLIDLKKELLEQKLSAVDRSLPALITFGIGLGTHIEFIAENIPVKDWLILEPNEDFFYISLHTLDWERVFKNFERHGRYLALFVGEEAYNHGKINSFFNTIGPFKTSTAFLFVHYLTKDAKDFLNKVATELARHISFFGFFDDEVISLKHTLTNIKNRVQLLNPHGKKLKPDIPAVVVGSGPSLEKYIDLLKEHQEKLFIISCGSALGILEKQGIVPDLHVNIERNAPPYEAVMVSTTEEFRKKIPFAGANNNYPPFFEAFGKNAMYLKAADAGAMLFPQPPLYFVNPTVTNTGLAMAFYLGFERVYLLGVDLAFPEKKHHAKGSVYETAFKDIAEQIYKGNIEVEGNFGGRLPTTSIFYSSLRIMEESIEFFTSQRKFEVFNPNFGAKIEGAETLKPEELKEHWRELKNTKENFSSKWWNNVVEPLKDEWFDFPRVKMQLLTNFHQLKMVVEEKLSEAQDINSYAEAIQELYDYLRVLAPHNKMLHNMLHGTWNLFLAHMYVGIYSASPKEQKLEFLNRAKELFKEMLEEMEKELLKLYSFFPY
jgi:hypothetical protein